jgi:HlyD family secretion protein
MDSVISPTQNPATTKAVVVKMKKKKKRNRIIWFSLAGLLLLIIILIVAKSGKEKPIAVQTEKVSKRTITQVVQATGKVQPEFKVKVSPEVSGEIISLPFKEGAKVKKGELLAKIKPTSIQAQYDAGIAQLESAKARVEQSRAQKMTADLAFKRAKELQGKNLMSQADLEQAQSTSEVAQANYNAAKYEVNASQSSLTQLSVALRKTSVVSPMEGVITDLISQLGEKVVGTSQFTGTEMMTVSDLSVMNAEVDVDENDVINIKFGDTARVTIDAFPNRTFTGTVVEIANSAKLKGAGSQDQSTNFAVKIRLAGFEIGELRPGMSCTAKIETETKSDIMTVPIMAVTRRGGMNTEKKETTEKPVAEVGSTTKIKDTKEDEAPTIVFIVENGRAKSVPVKTGISDNSYVEITQGLGGGEEVIKGNYSAVSKDLDDKKLIRIDNGGVGTGKTDEKKK